MAEFTLDEDQQQIQDMARKFAANELRPIARDCDEGAEFPIDILNKIWELGICANSIPESYGGYELGRSSLTSAIMVEELAWGDVNLTLGAMAPLLMMIPILEFGTDEQKEEWLPKFCGDSYFPCTAALMEPRITFDPFELQTTAETKGDEIVINGTKCMVPMADSAEHILVYVSATDGNGTSSIKAVIVDKGTPGLTIGKREENLGLNALPLFPIIFEDCTVSAARCVGGEAGINFGRLLNLSKVNLSAMAVGVARASYEYALEYAKERIAFGEPIAYRQSIAFMLAEAAIEVDAMRLMAWKAAWCLDRNEDATREASLAKMYSGEQAMKVVDYGVQILGGHGYIREHPVEMWLRNGRGFGIMEGLAIA